MSSIRHIIFQAKYDTLISDISYIKDTNFKNKDDIKSIIKTIDSVVNNMELLSDEYGDNFNHEKNTILKWKEILTNKI